MTTEDAKAIIRHGIVDMTVTTEMITDDELRRDPLALAIMSYFPLINPFVCSQYTDFHFDGGLRCTHSRDLKLWIKLIDTFDGVYKEPINFRIDGMNKTITLVTEVKRRSEEYGEIHLILPDNHPEVEEGEYQYPIGKLITVAGRCYALRVHKDKDAHTCIGGFTNMFDALERVEYANDQLQLKP